MTTATQDRPAAGTAEDELRALVQDWIDAVRASDIDRIMAHYDPGVVAYDAILALRFQGADAYREHFAKCLEMCPGEPLMEAHDIHAMAEGELGIAHYVLRCGAVDDDGKEQTGWMRATLAARRSGGRWRIVHEHYSAPFDPESGQAMMDTAP